MSKTTLQRTSRGGRALRSLKRKWNPNMAPYIFMEKNGIHIIDLHKTLAKLEEAANALKQIATSGKENSFRCHQETSERHHPQACW